MNTQNTQTQTTLPEWTAQDEIELRNKLKEFDCLALLDGISSDEILNSLGDLDDL